MAGAITAVWERFGFICVNDALYRFDRKTGQTWVRGITGWSVIEEPKSGGVHA